ncbi:hypothetical protein LCGC14_1820450 [marine sediment metagenome]|uniref:DUF4190 domain-containing protein n=1 Tax=marine sediment metagenome TaxID=412755 RepID=A0A0F9GJ93_9ZZZZ
MKIPVFLKHVRDTKGDYQMRVLIHIPVGLLIGIPFLGYPLLRLFCAYQESEDRHETDKAWKDYAGAMVGASITILGILIGLGVYLLSL